MQKVMEVYKASGRGCHACHEAEKGRGSVLRGFTKNKEKKNYQEAYPGIMPYPYIGIM